MSEVYLNGFVEVGFTVYADFTHYKSGVYKHVTGGMMGGHAVKLIGWGMILEKITGYAVGSPYYYVHCQTMRPAPKLFCFILSAFQLLANQWNRGWGDDGYFKIIRGVNECGIEEDVLLECHRERTWLETTAAPLEQL
uniref:Peptidase C1A papain C-terminal domain-containing protein n=1 Tax=Setaria viridis TaxID=4556 RepID=A0A4U6SP37_SETVI|nr:hypothetical protein SEVIR_9G000400v2 [Setaria viridis]